jgi:hypothetical protein
MKKRIFTTILALAFITFNSCDSNKISNLTNTVSELSEQNSKLKDSIQLLKQKTILAFHIFATLEQKSLKVNEEGKIDFLFGYKDNIDYISEYDVYKLTGDNYEVRKLILENQKLSEFEYNYTPKSIDDNRVRLLVIFKLDGYEVELPADVTINVTN